MPPQYGQTQSRYDQPQPQYVQQPYAMQEPMTMGKWMLCLFVMFVPVLNIVMLIVWTVSDDGNAVRRTWAKAQLVWMLIAAAVAAVASLAVGSVFEDAIMHSAEPGISYDLNSDGYSLNMGDLDLNSDDYSLNMGDLDLNSDDYSLNMDDFDLNSDDYSLNMDDFDLNVDGR